MSLWFDGKKNAAVKTLESLQIGIWGWIQEKLDFSGI